MSSLPTRPPARARSGPLVSVVTPTLDRPRLLSAALGSIAAQNLRGDVEVIVVNDGGSPIAPVIRAWQHLLAITVVDLGETSGPATARNAGVEAATGKYIAFLDDDDVFLPGHLEAGCEPLERSDADFVYLGAIVTSHRLAALPPDLSTFRVKAYPYDERFLLVANFLHTGSVLVRNFRNTAVRFDQALEVCEDWDLWLALTMSLGYRVSFVSRITSVYHQVPGIPGLVAGAQLASPSKFALARDYIHAKWPSADPLVRDYREWMNALERLRSDLIARDQRMPNLLFDEILTFLHRRISQGRPADHTDISRFFSGVSTAL